MLGNLPVNIPLRFFPPNFETEMSRESGKVFQRKCLLSWHLSRDSHGASLGETTVFLESFLLFSTGRRIASYLCVTSAISKFEVTARPLPPSAPHSDLVTKCESPHTRPKCQMATDNNKLRITAAFLFCIFDY